MIYLFTCILALSFYFALFHRNSLAGIYFLVVAVASIVLFIPKPGLQLVVFRLVCAPHFVTSFPILSDLLLLLLLLLLLFTHRQGC